MRGTVLATLLLSGALAAGQGDGSRDYQVRPLDFKVTLPGGWTAEQGPTGMVAHDAAQNGVIVSREPFFHDDDTFADVWQAELAAAGKDAKVERKRISSRYFWRAQWTAGDRTIEVWRLHEPDTEMLYNFAFSAAKDYDLKSVADDILKSFKCTAEKPKLKFQPDTQAATTTIQVRLPEGYYKSQRLGGISLGGGLSGSFVKTLPGYDPPHIAGELRFRGLPAAALSYMGGNVEKLLESSWSEDQEKFASVLKKPRSRSATYSGVKGSTLEVQVMGKDGKPRRWLGFCGKHKQDVVELILVVDEREVRLHDDLLKDICSEFEVER